MENWEIQAAETVLLGPTCLLQEIGHVLPVKRNWKSLFATLRDAARPGLCHRHYTEIINLFRKWSCRNLILLIPSLTSAQCTMHRGYTPLRYSFFSLSGIESSEEVTHLTPGLFHFVFLKLILSFLSSTETWRTRVRKPWAHMLLNKLNHSCFFVIIPLDRNRSLLFVLFNQYCMF